MKKLIAILLALLLTVSVCGCDSGNGGSKRSRTAPATGSDLTWDEIEKLAEPAPGNDVTSQKTE